MLRLQLLLGDSDNTGDEKRRSRFGALIATAILAVVVLVIPRSATATEDGRQLAAVFPKATVFAVTEGGTETVQSSLEASSQSDDSDVTEATAIDVSESRTRYSPSFLPTPSPGHSHKLCRGNRGRYVYDHGSTCTCPRGQQCLHRHLPQRERDRERERSRGPFRTKITNNLRYTIYVIRYTLYDIRYTLYDIRYTLYHIRHTIYDIRNAIYVIR